MTAWSPVQGVTVRNTEHHTGIYAARATSTGTAVYAQRTLPASAADVTLDAWFKIVSISTEASVLVVRTASGALVTLALAKTRRLLTRNAVSGATVTSTTAPTASVWHELQLRAVIGSAGSVGVWLDGVKVTALSTTQNLGSGRITAIQIGGTDKNRKYDVVFDDVMVSLPDTTAPSVPTGVSATSTAPREVTVTWSASTDDLGVTSYAVVRDGTQIGTVNGTTLRYVDSNLASAHTYRYTVAALDGTGNRSSASATATVTTPDSQAPTVPTGVTATSTAPREVTVTWSASSDDVGVTSYALVRDGIQIGTVNGTTLRYVDSGLASAHTYGYSVAALDAAGNRSAASATATVSTPDSQAPTVPQGVNASASGSLQITVTWSASSDDVGVTSYAIVRDGTQIGTVNGTTLSYTDRGVAAGQHSYTVAALDAAGNRSNPSLTASAASADSQAPTVPQAVGANASGSLQVTVTWNASSDDVGVTSYAIVRDGTQIGTVNGTTLSYIDRGVVPGQHTYSVAALDAAGNRSNPSATAGATAADTQAPTVPQGVGANESGSLEITVTWTASTDDVGVTSYAIVRDGTEIGTVNGTKLSYIDRGVAAGQHTYSVAALDAAGNRSDPSATASATVDDTQAPGSPTLVTGAATDFDTVSLTWTAVTDDVGVAGYGIYRGDVLVATVDGSTTTYDDTGLAGSSTYTYTIDAFDAAGNRSAPSAPLDATTPAAPDRDPPSQPLQLTATATGPRAVDLEWGQSFDNIGVASYRVLRGGSTIATVTADPNPFADQTYHDGSVSPNTSYTYRVVALDAAGNISDPSDPASVTTPLDPDTQAPTPPGALQASAALPTEVDLTWTAATDDRLVTGYRVVRDGQLIAQLGADATSYADTSTDPSTHYAYGVQAVDAAGNVSTAATASATTPALPCNTAGGSLPPTTSATYRAFSAGSIWNAQVRSAPVDCNSDAMMAWLRGVSSNTYVRLAGANSTGTFGNPIYWSTSDDPAYAVTNTCPTVDAPPEFQAIRIPLSAQPDDSSDAAMTVYDLTSGTVVAFHHTVKTVASDGSVSWSACGGAAYHVDSNGLDGRAAGADDGRNVGHRGVPPPTYAVRWDEIQAGSIDHALKIAIDNTCDHVWPMVGDEGCSGGGLIPEGTRIRLRPSIDLSTYGLSPAALVIARALQRYGAYVGDQSGGGVTLKVENTVAEGRGNLWNGVLDPKSLSAIPLTAYEVVQRGWGAP